jgi:excisionase family DNA binding protein
LDENAPPPASEGSGTDPFALRATERYTMAEAARIKGVSYHTVSRAVRQGRLPVQRLGRMALITGQDLEQWQPMRERAPRRYREHPLPPDSAPVPAVLDEALGERMELARQLSALFEVIHAATSELGLDAFCELLARRFSSMFGLSRVALWVCHPRDGSIERIASFGPPLSRAPDRLQFTQLGRAMQAIEQGLPRISIDPRAEFLLSPERKDSVPPGPLLIVPLRARNRTIGAIFGDRQGAALTLDEDQLALAQVLANQAALGISNVLMRQEEQYRIARHAAILDQVTDLVRACDIHGRLEVSNRADQAFRSAEGVVTPRTGESAFDNPAIVARTEVDGTPITDSAHPLARALRGEVVQDWEYLVTRIDGSVVRARVNAMPLVINGEVTGAVYIGRDVTREYEVEARERKFLARLDRLESQLLSIDALGTDLTTATEANEVLAYAVEFLGRHIEARSVFALTVREDGGLELAGAAEAVRDNGFPVVHDPVAIATTIQAFAREQPVSADFEVAGKAEQLAMQLSGASRLTVLPLQQREQRFGALYLLLDATTTLAESDLALAAVVARLTSHALGHLRGRAAEEPAR